MEPNRHDHITGRTRRYISRKWFHRARHRPNKHRESVAELVEAIGTEIRCTQPWRTQGWHLIESSGHFCYHGQIAIPKNFDPQPGIVVISAPEALTIVSPLKGKQ